MSLKYQQDFRKAYLFEDLCGEVHDSIDSGKLLEYKQSDADLNSPHSQKLNGTLLSHCHLRTCSQQCSALHDVSCIMCAVCLGQESKKHNPILLCPWNDALIHDYPSTMLTKERMCMLQCSKRLPTLQA